MAVITIEKQDLLGMLEDSLSLAQREDEKSLAKHRKDEQAALERFKCELRALLKLDYAKAKKASSVYFHGPSCPMVKANRIKAAIQQVKIDSRKGPYRLQQNHEWYTAATWKPDAEKKALCD